MRVSLPPALALCLAVVSCQRPAPVAPVVPQRTLLPPVSVDATNLPRLRSPNIGLVLGAGGPKRAQPIELAALPVRVQLAFRQPLATSVTVAPSNPRSAKPTWQSGLAELVIAQTLAIHPDEYDIAIGGPVDSGATLAVAIMAGFTTTPMPTDAGIAADIASDGTLVTAEDAPSVVASIIERDAERVLLARAQPGLRRGKRFIDLRRQVKEADKTSEVVSDVTQAYRQLLRQPMPEPLPSPAESMKSSETTVQALELGYVEMVADFADALPRLVTIQDRANLTEQEARLIARAHRGARAAERLRSAGDVAAAYLEMMGAWQAARSAHTLDDIAEAVIAGDRTGAMAAFAAADAEAEGRNGTGEPTFGDVVADLVEMRYLAAERAHRELAELSQPAAEAAIDRALAMDDETRRHREHRNRLIDQIARPVGERIAARATSRLRRDLAASAEPSGPPATLDGARLSEVTRLYLETARAGSQPSMRTDDRAWLERLFDDGPTDDALFDLASARLAFDETARQIDRARRRLASREDIRREMRLARRAALQHASAAHIAIDQIPPVARIWFQAAETYRQRSASHGQAIDLYRLASSECRQALLIALSRPRPAIPEPAAGPSPSSASR